MTGMTYLAVWPIVDDSRPASALIAEAAGSLDIMAARDGARIVGDPTWTVAGDRLVCSATAEPLPATAPAPDPDVEVLRLANLRWTPKQIGALLGMAPDTVQAALARHKHQTTHAPDIESEES